MLVVAGAAWAAAAPAAGEAPALAVRVDASAVIRTFRPDRALGAGLDGHEHGDVRRIYTAANIRAMAAAGLGPISYRLRTELGVAAWHWNPRGRWSDPRHHRGYWTSSASPRGRIDVSYGYALPRRGDTIDQAEDSGYSRLDDGRPQTFWKSNPYLDPHYVHRRLPQWVVVDLGRPRPVDALRIAWGTPWATRFSVAWWDGPQALFLQGARPGHWRRLGPHVLHGRGGSELVRLAPRSRRVRFVRLLLAQGSRTAPPGSHDVRDRLGFAIRELGVGRLSHGRFVDLVRHRPDQRQTVTMTSSTDPWHRASDLAPNYEQPGFDRVLGSGLTRGLPMLVPAATLYGTPADAVAELRWLRARHVPLRGIELGEEPDGQVASPEDDAALYGVFERALRRVDPRVPVGGPSLETQVPDWPFWPDARGDRSWTARFLRALRRERARLGFFSFEWYPFDNTCAPPGPQLARATAMFDRQLAAQRAHGLGAHVPVYVTEYGFSAFAGAAEVGRAGAVFDADAVGTFLRDGVSTAYLYGLEPDQLISEQSRCSTWGNLILQQTDSAWHIKRPVAAYWAVRMLTRDWTQPGDGVHALLRTAVPSGAPIGAYAVRRPDGRVAVLLVNRSPTRTLQVRLSGVAAPLTTWTLSDRTYRWHPAGPGGYAFPDRPPARASSADGTVALGPLSVVVAMGARAQARATAR